MNFIKIVQSSCLYGLPLLSVISLSACSSDNETQQQTNETALSSTTNNSVLVAVGEEKKQEILEDLQGHSQKLGLCEGQIDASTSSDQSSVYQIDEDKYLVELLCFLGAYQGNYQYLVYEPDSDIPQVKIVDLPIFQANESGNIERVEVNSIAGLPEYSPEENRLTVFTKYRGLADCGSLGSYQWKNEDFQLLEFRVKEACDGNYLDPEQYSKVYP